MLSYQHEFHAGNHADILKHQVLVFILEHLKKKDKPFTVFDTHAGAGRYLLDDERSRKTGEAGNGIQRLLGTGGLPARMDSYLALCRLYGEQRMYPGSPEIERCMLREGDRLILSELHPAEIQVLQENMRQPVLVPDQTAVHAAVHHRDGWEMLRALTPPQIKRGLAVIDPSYEEGTDYTRTAETVADVRRKWPAGIIMVWYPLLHHRRGETTAMKRSLKAAAQAGINQADVLDIQLHISQPESHQETDLASFKAQKAEGTNTPRLYGSGVFIINPPWQLAQDCEAVLPAVAAALSDQGSWSVSTSGL